MLTTRQIMAMSILIDAFKKYLGVEIIIGSSVDNQWHDTKMSVEAEIFTHNHKQHFSITVANTFVDAFHKKVWKQNDNIVLDSGGVAFSIRKEFRQQLADEIRDNFDIELDIDNVYHPNAVKFSLTEFTPELCLFVLGFMYEPDFALKEYQDGANNKEI